MTQKIIHKREASRKLSERLEAFRLKVKAEEAALHEKNETKIAEMVQRLDDMGKELFEIENLDIVGTVRSYNISIEELEELLASRYPKHPEERNDYEE